jgi:hypothetical protein
MIGYIIQGTKPAHWHVQCQDDDDLIAYVQGKGVIKPRQHGALTMHASAAAASAMAAAPLGKPSSL